MTKITRVLSLVAGGGLFLGLRLLPLNEPGPLLVTIVGVGSILLAIGEIGPSGLHGGIAWCGRQWQRIRSDGNDTLPDRVQSGPRQTFKPMASGKCIKMHLH